MQKFRLGFVLIIKFFNDISCKCAIFPMWFRAKLSLTSFVIANEFYIIRLTFVQTSQRNSDLFSCRKICRLSFAFVLRSLHNPTQFRAVPIKNSDFVSCGMHRKTPIWFRAEVLQRLSSAPAVTDADKTTISCVSLLSIKGTPCDAKRNPFWGKCYKLDKSHVSFLPHAAFFRRVFCAPPAVPGTRSSCNCDAFTLFLSARYKVGFAPIIAYSALLSASNSLHEAKSEYGQFSFIPTQHLYFICRCIPAIISGGKPVPFLRIPHAFA